MAELNNKNQNTIKPMQSSQSPNSRQITPSSQRNVGIQNQTRPVQQRLLNNINHPNTDLQHSNLQNKNINQTRQNVVNNQANNVNNKEEKDLQQKDLESLNQENTSNKKEKPKKESKEKKEKEPKEKKERRPFKVGMFLIYMMLFISIIIGGAFGGYAIYKHFDVEEPVTTTKIIFETTLKGNIGASIYELSNDENYSETLLNTNTNEYEWNNGDYLTFKIELTMQDENDYLRFRSYTLYHQNETSSLLQFTYIGLPEVLQKPNDDGYYYFHRENADINTPRPYTLTFYVQIKFEFKNYNGQYINEEIKQVLNFECVEDKLEWINNEFEHEQKFPKSN